MIDTQIMETFVNIARELYEQSYDDKIGEESPIWTDEHIDELLNDFYVIPKDVATIEVEPVRHGKWECVNDDENVYMASCCGGELLLESGTPLNFEMVFPLLRRKNGR